jgi:hypothetical protein
MGGLANLFSALTTILGVRGYPWLGPLVVLVLFGLFFPKIWANQREGEVKRKLARASMERREERMRQEQALIDALSKEPSALLAIAEEALRRNRKDLAQAAVDRLTPDQRTRLAARLSLVERQLKPPNELPATLDEGLLKIERFLASGATASARELALKMQTRWKDAPELQVILEQLDSSNPQS